MSKRSSKPKAMPQPTREQQAVGIALAGSSIVTPLLLALLDKVLTFEEIQAICARAREIAGNFDDRPEGRFALACLDDFLLARAPVSHDADARSPALVPSDPADGAPRSDNEDVTATRA